MLAPELKERFLFLLDTMPPEDTQKVLDFASKLGQKKQAPGATQSVDDWAVDDWETSLAKAESFWFSLPTSTRKRYSGQIVAIVNNKIVDADLSISELRRRIVDTFRGKPVLLIDADAEQEPALFVRSPRLR